MVQLVLPSQEYKESYLEALKEFQNEGLDLIYNLEEIRADFEKFIQRLHGFSIGIDLPAGFVPETRFWLVDGADVIGTTSIRHTLNDNLLKIGGHIGYEIRPSKRRRGYGKEILRLALLKAKEMGITKALITCDETNTGSRKIIEANGGVLENIYFYDKNMPRKMRFWISLE